METNLVVGVFILDAPYHADVIYDYRVPPEMGGAIKVGRFVTVPFGIRNNLRRALVWEVRTHSQYKDLKPVRYVSPEQISLDEEMMGLCEFIKKRTLCTTGDAVRAMVPSAALTKLSEFYSLNPATIPQDSDVKLPSDLLLYTYLKEHGETTLLRLRSELDIRVEDSARRMAAKGLLLRRVEFTEASEGKAELYWSLAVSPDAARELSEGKACNDCKLTSPNHKSIMAVLAEDPAPIGTAELRAQAKVTLAQIKALEAKGLLICEEQRVDRNPYTEAPFVGQTPQSLSEQQQRALEELDELCLSGEPRAALLHGVTGSGKTRVMTALIDRLLERGRGVIVLLPEIALTPQSVSVFCSRYGDRVAVIHSALSTGERYDAYCRIKRGDATVVIGTRSAVFAPVRRLGAIIIDEEQEHTYKSDQNPKYLTKDIARYRCNHHRALMLPASATPSLESYKKAKEGAYKLVELTERYGNAVLPTVEIADMRREAQEGNTSALSRALVAAIGETLQRGEQTVLFLNRRGYNRNVTCRACGHPLVCPNCSVAMTYHTHRYTYKEGEMVCHWCGKRLSVPRACPDCGSEHLGHMGYGTQRIEEELAELFPTARILRMDADTTASKTSYERLLGKFRSHEADILLGTQMVTKGHDFPDVTLVGVLLADASLYLDDYRASERTFAMLTQVIGRAGRGKLRGRALIQTNNPDHEIIHLAARQDYPAFYEREIRLRRLLCFPPSCDVALITVSGEVDYITVQAADRMRMELEELRGWEEFKSVELIPFGPFEAPVYRVDNRYRMRMVVKCRLTPATLELFSTLLCRFGNGIGKRIHIGIDFNPSSL